MKIKILFFGFFLSFRTLTFAEPIPLENFAKHASYNSIKISPDGKHFAAAAPFEDQTILVIINRETMKPTYAFKFQQNQHVNDYHWANNERLVFNRLVRKSIAEQPSFYGQIFAANLDGSKQEIIFGYSGGKAQTGGRTGRNRGPDRAWGDFLHMLPDDPKNIIISARGMGTDADVPYRIVKLNIYNSRKVEITRTPLGNVSVMFNAKGELILSSGLDVKGNDRAFFYENDDWVEIGEDDALADYNVFSINKQSSKLYLSAFENKGTESIYEYDLESKKITKIFNHKTSDVFGLIRDPSDNSVVGVEVMPNYLEYHYLDSDNNFAKTHKNLTVAFKNQDITITSSTKDLKEHVVLVRSDKNPGDFYIFNTETNSIKYLLSRKRWIDPKQMAAKEPIQFAARDGTTLYGYITIPKDITKKVPLVTYVHGGPFSIQDTWLYDSTAQMLANNGYAVLQVNYRGSGGYGRNYEESGYKKMGTLIQNDIIDATRYVMSFDEINDKACIMGWSFGGYSAVMAPIVEPELFKCSIAAAGVYDAVEELNDADFSKVASIKSRVEVEWGDNENKLRQDSPLTHIDKLTIPVFIVHGGKDERVPPEQAYLLRDALKKRKMPYQWMFKKKEGHGFYNEKNKTEFYKKSLEFLDKYLK